MRANYKIAGIVVDIKSESAYVTNKLKKYITNEKAQYSIDSMYKIEELMEKNKHLNKDEAEYVKLGTEFYRKLLFKQGIFLHSSAVLVDKEVYLFSGPCGAGKSTHASLYLKYNEKAIIINDDKPAIKIEDGKFNVYGTPFSGKTDKNENLSGKLKGIVFIKQGTNSIKRIEKKEAVYLFLNQTLREKTKMENILNLVGIIIDNIPIYELTCDISKEAYELSFNTLRGEIK